MYARKMTPFSWFLEFAPPFENKNVFAKMGTSMAYALTGGGGCWMVMEGPLVQMVNQSEWLNGNGRVSCPNGQ